MSGALRLLVALLLVTTTACSGSSGGSEPTTVAASTTATSVPGDATATTTSTAAAPSTTGGGGGLDVDPCQLLTGAEITAATGVPFGEGVPNDVITGDDQAACDWISTGSEFATAQVLLVNAGPGQFESARGDAESVFGLTTEPVAVPGADQTYATAEGSIVAMDIGGRFVQVSYIPAGPGTVLDETLQLAAIVAGRMP
jgi:hypothetical protein